MADAKFIGEDSIDALYQNVQGDMSNFSNATTPSFKKVDDAIKALDTKVSGIQKATEVEFETWLASVGED